MTRAGVGEDPADAASRDIFEQGYFEKNYRNYERQNPPRKLRFYREIAERAAPKDRVPSLLDVGCAFGAFLGSLSPTWQRFGSDVSRFAIDRAKERVPGATFAAADFGSIPFSGPFDILTSFDVIEHVPSLDNVATTVRSKLRPGGHLIFVVPVYDGPTGPVIRLLDHDETHVHKQSRDFWLDWTRRNFTLVEWWGIYRYLMPGGFY
ncbi:MAG: class I SAM-dependent methyltransferase, partial [Candidatus Eiseniibacteriota bacterium]